MLSQRLASAAIGIPLVALAVWTGGETFAAVVAAAVFIATVEFGAARGEARAPLTLLAAAFAALLPAAALAGEDWIVAALAGAVLVLSGGFTLTTRDLQAGVVSWLWGVASLLYFGLLAGHFVLLREVDNGRAWLFFVLLTVWITDTGAYAIGRMLGRHKLAPLISPGKTIEGAIGSAVAGFIAVFVLNEAIGLDLALGHRIALGLLLPPVILVGDLAESALKRALGVKDSSGLVPGHGGIADRLDSLLFAVPAVYYYLKWII